ncbi:alpha/beta-hydrolase [Amniculicola lignicola CBS 123094]|uniref:Alpha/beta-hydrolase n=1 Tax=Amniculicola lignicola CBS 123094 TaxID=1392246 RepID=A0A6A5WN75_9PLEO|nr:alpha/beta-hydrolase [Amniculicola lignicola CBS 123094]
MTKPALLYVTMQPKPPLSPSQFHDWYNNEHGPGRLRLPFCQNGFRYRATDLDSPAGGSQSQPEWMALYDFDSMDRFTQDEYTRLRKDPIQSQRERDTMKQIFVDRKFYSLENSWVSPEFEKLEDVAKEGEKSVLISVLVTLQSGPGIEAEFLKWYEEEHIQMVQKVPGWRRTRRFALSQLDVDAGKRAEHLILHDWASANGIQGEAMKAATSTPWAQKIYKEVYEKRTLRKYDLCYTFGPAARDLASLMDDQTVAAQSTDGLTRTLPAKDSGVDRPVIESFITTPDGASLPYRLEGNASPNAPLLVCINSILVDYGIWDDFIPAFLTATKNKYRVLRYNTRGRFTLPETSTKDITVDTLAADVITILDALRVPTAAVVGVSLGGATALNLALKYPSRISAFVACDTNAMAPPGNPRAWGERIDMAASEASTSLSGEKVVGQNLAEATVRRWFTPQSYASASFLPRIEAVKNMVATNSLAGLQDSVRALYAYDFRPEMGGFTGKGAFLVGAGDGVLPKSMKEMAASLGTGVELKVVEGAGHLPMVERPGEVGESVGGFLER